MDTTPEYIKMCLKATEIQDLRDRPELSFNQKLWSDGDVFYDGEIAGVWCDDCNADGGAWDMRGYVFLPRQDQLQVMVEWTPEMLWEDLSTSDE